MNQPRFYILFLLLVALSAAGPAVVWAADGSSAPNLAPELQIKIGDFGQASDFQVGYGEGSCPPEKSQYGKCLEVPWISQYIGAIYRYGVALAAALAMLMITIGGAIWLTAGGSSERVSTAKSFISSALVGLTLALSSYAILYAVNPALVALKPLQIKEVENVVLNLGSGDAELGKVACQVSTHTIAYDQVGLPSGTLPVTDVSDVVDQLTSSDSVRLGALALPSRCRDYNFDGYGVDANILRAIASTESSCNPSAQNTSGGAYGLMQITLPTARALAGRAVTADELKSDPQLSIELAARYIQQNQNVHQGKIAHILAGYNGGYGTSVGTSGKRPPMAQSADCPGFLAYECCENPGGLEETRGYVVRGMRYYQGAQNGQYE